MGLYEEKQIEEIMEKTQSHMISQNLLQINETNIDQLIEPNQELLLKNKKEVKVIDKK